MVSVIHLVSNLLDDFIHSVSYLLALFTILCLLTSFTVSCLSAHFLTNIFWSASFTLSQNHLTSVIQPIACNLFHLVTHSLCLNSVTQCHLLRFKSLSMSFTLSLGYCHSLCLISHDHCHLPYLLVSVINPISDLLFSIIHPVYTINCLIS